MTVLLFADSDDKTVNNCLLRIIKSKTGCSYLEPVHSLESLKIRLRRLPKGIDIAILLAKDKEQLSEFISMKDFLDGISLILILPDLEKKTISDATKLYPSFISSMDSDFILVSDVLGNMLNLKEKRYSIKGI
jgi:hypothetical protein